MPDLSNSVPLFPDLVSDDGTKNYPGDRKSDTASTTEETDIMPNTVTSDIDVFVRENIREIMQFLRSKCKEKGITHDELMTVTKIPHASFYRLWKMGLPEEQLTDEDKRPSKPNADHVCRLCIALGVSLAEFQHPPTDDSIMYLPALKENSHEEVMNGIWGEIASLRDAISGLEAERERLESDNRRLSDIAFSREEDIRTNIARINKLTDALIERHDQMHELNRLHNDRVDRLDTALRQRYDQLHELFMAVISGNPQRLMDLIQESEKTKHT